MKANICLLILMVSLLYSCKNEHSLINTFEDKVFLVENDPQLYLSKIDTTESRQLRNCKEATDFILSALAYNYVNNDSYPKKEQLQKCIQIFKKEKQVQQQLEAQYLLAGVFRAEKDLINEVQIIEESIDLAKNEDDNEWLFYLYSYLGDMYISI